MDPVRRVPSGQRRLIAQELQLTASGKDRTLYFHGESMRPLLIEGDEVVVEPIEWRRIRIGDVITYRYLDRFPTRRVVGRTADQVKLWCENWPYRFFFARREAVLGRATARRRGGKWITNRNWEWRTACWKALGRYARVTVLMPAYWRAIELGGNLRRALRLRRPQRQS